MKETIFSHDITKSFQDMRVSAIFNDIMKSFFYIMKRFSDTMKNIFHDIIKAFPPFRDVNNIFHDIMKSRFNVKTAGYMFTGT